MIDPREAAEDAVDSDRRLPGEDPTSPFPEDAEHWASVYTELNEMKGELLESVEERTAEMDPDARAEVEATDLPVLNAEAGRLRRRLKFWKDRLRRLREAG